MHSAQRNRSGFTLLEALVALLLVTLSLLLGYGLIARQPMAATRLEAGDEALRAIEASLETIRASHEVPESRILQPLVDYPPPLKARDLLLHLDVKPAAGVEGLLQVKVESRYRVGRKIHRRRVETLLWRP